MVKIDLLGQLCALVDLDTGAGLADIAHDTVHRRAALVDFGDAAEIHLVA